MKNTLIRIVALTMVVIIVIIVSGTPTSFLIAKAAEETDTIESANSVDTYHPIESNQVLNNPFMGWVPWGTVKNYPQPHSMVFAQTTWRELEPQKGNYNFSDFETKYNFDYWKSQNKKIMIQVNLDYPGESDHIDIPDWLYDEIEQDGIHYDVDYGMGFSPNYNNPKLISYHSKLIEELAKRYNDDNSVFMVVLGSVGHWGEWHTSQDLDHAFPKLEISDQYIKPYIDGFTKKFLSVRRPLQIAKDYHMGLHNNSIGSDYQTNTLFLKWINNGYNWFLTNEDNPAMPDFWKVSPSGGEFTAYPGTSLLTESTISDTLEQLKNSHTSWIGPSCPINEPFEGTYQENIDKVLKTIGYRFVLQSIRHPKSVTQDSDININMVWINRGIAPFYYDWPMELSLSDSDGNIVYRTTVPVDIRTILPGEKSIEFTLKIPKEISTGTYKLCVAILNPDNNEPGVDLAIEGRREDGRYELDHMSIETPITNSNPTPIPTPVPTPIPDPTPNPVPDPIPNPGPDPIPNPVPNPIPDSIPNPVPNPIPDPIPNPVPNNESDYSTLPTRDEETTVTFPDNNLNTGAGDSESNPPLDNHVLPTKVTSNLLKHFLQNPFLFYKSRIYFINRFTLWLTLRL